MIMCSACIPVMAKYRKKKIWVFCAMSGGSGFWLGLPVFASIGGLTKLADVKACAGDVVLLPLFVVFDRLDAKERQAEDVGQHQHQHQQLALAHLSRPHANRHAETRGNEDDRVGRPERDAELVRSRHERVVVPVAVQQVREEHAAEEHDFGQEEQPHAEASRLALLFLRLEMMTVLRQHEMFVVLVDTCQVSVFPVGSLQSY